VLEGFLNNFVELALNFIGAIGKNSLSSYSEELKGTPPSISEELKGTPPRSSEELKGTPLSSQKS
jgi:hypothetical protein